MRVSLAIERVDKAARLELSHKEIVEEFCGSASLALGFLPARSARTDFIASPRVIQGGHVSDDNEVNAMRTSRNANDSAA